MGLLTELGLNNFTPSTKNTNEVSFSNSFATTGRLDAEYYQPKYAELEERIKGYSGGCTNLKTYVENYSTGFPYKSQSYVDDGIPIIRINNIKKGSLDTSNIVNP